ncbi:hypothetical protein SAMN05880501_101768 [Ureibacillus xyleni]|uniref:Uncharacterized protein n=1 Tax=Ureibacillus xyleni TaxID=614648 RepID=A0A285RKA0_9BACL|nr:hypothetical protein [Ureibacillus xyleni]SOB94148.1 hypothetical protein SAMN05880501_101768 [Ureibacillus xyleni]
MGVNHTNAQISIANNCEEDIYILIVPFQEWDWGDRGFDINSNNEFKYHIKCLSSLSRLISQLNVYPMVPINSSSMVEHILETVQDIKRDVIAFLNKEAIIIPSGHLRKITSDKGNNSLRTFALFGWGSLFGVSDVTLFIVSATLDRQAIIKTSYQESWVVQQDEIGKAKKGAFWEIDRSNDFYQFSISC